MKKELNTRQLRVSFNPLPDGTLYFLDLPYMEAGGDFLDAANIIAKLIVIRGQILYNIRPRRIMLKFPPDYDGCETVLDFIRDYNGCKSSPFNISTNGKEWERCNWTLYSNGEPSSTLNDTITPYFMAPDDF